MCSLGDGWGGCCYVWDGFEYLQHGITLFRSITMYFGTESIPWIILHIQSECGKYPGILCGILSVSQNIVMDQSHVMSDLE